MALKKGVMCLRHDLLIGYEQEKRGVLYKAPHSISL